MPLFDVGKVMLTPEMLEEVQRKYRADWRSRQPVCELCNQITGRPRQLHCTTCGDAFQFCRECVAEPAGDVRCGPCGESYEKALEG